MRNPRSKPDRASSRGRPRDGGPPLAILYGVHAVTEALRNPARRPHRLLATENGARRLRESLDALPIEPQIVLPRAIDALLDPDAVHQGLLLEAAPLADPGLDALPSDALVLVLDQITDPHNVGAIVRTAAAFGVDAIVTTERHSPEATGVLAKAASGGLEHVPIVSVHNLGDALDRLGRQAYLRVGLDSEGETLLSEVPMQRPLALVLGAEGKGLRQRTRSLCDTLARIDLRGPIRSLNVSNAAAIALHLAATAKATR